jgi:hypothetical protein
MSQGHLNRFSHTSEAKRSRTDGSNGSATPKAGVAQNTAYEKYKASLHAFFEGKAPIPEFIKQAAPGHETEDKKSAEALKNLNEAKPAGKSDKKTELRPSRRLSSSSSCGYDVFIEAIKRSTTPDEITRTVGALLEAGMTLPLDEEILSKALSHRDESVVVDILQKLSDLIATQPSKSPRLLKTRIENAALLASSSDIKELCLSLRAAIG